jgi:hypothetical protein
MKRAGVVFAERFHCGPPHQSLSCPATNKKENNLMKKLPAALVALFLAVAPGLRAQFITVNNFDNVQFWTGSGPNRSVLVLEFSADDSPTSIAWGYRWSGSATLQDLVFSAAGGLVGGPAPLPGADARLAFDVSFFSFGDVSGYFVNSIAYNQIGLPAPWSQSVRLIENNYFDDQTYPALYFLADSGIWTASPFSAADVGMSDLSLSNGAWYGFVQTDEFEGDRIFAQPASAVPEPRVWALLIVGAALLGLAKRKL